MAIAVPLPKTGTFSSIFMEILIEMGHSLGLQWKGQIPCGGGVKHGRNRKQKINRKNGDKIQRKISFNAPESAVQMAETPTSVLH